MLTPKIQLTLFALLLVAISHRSSSAVPLENSNKTSIIKDDLTTEFAREIIRRAKAAEINAQLNTKIDPCSDFYSYSCGNWHRNNPAQLLAKLMTDTFQLIAKSFDRRLLQILQAQTSDVDLEAKVQRFYQACKLVHRDDVRYKLELENVYKEFGELPVLVGEGWNETDFNWWETIAKIQYKYGQQIILAVDIMGDIKNNTENRVYIGPPEYTKLTNSKILNVIEEASTAADMQHYFGIEQKLAKQTAKELSEFERKLMQGGADMRELGLQDLLGLQKLETLQKNYAAHINFTQFLGTVLGEDVPESVYIYDEEYFKKMLKTIEETPKRILANYILWQVLQEYLADALAEDIPKWCIEKTKKYFGKYVDHMVYKRYRSEESEADVKQVWQEIRSTYRDQLRGDKHDWISNATRTKAIEKLDEMKLYINSYDEENFEELYGNLLIDRKDYVQNVQKILMVENARRLQKLHDAPTTLEASEVLSFTPAYNILENHIKIPVALLQPRFFWDENYPQALKYATLGYLIAHEMIHGFDDDGRNYDKFGNQISWWDSKSTYEFEERRKCFQAQYHNYKYGGTKLPESVLQSENIADNAGVKLAYTAYIRWLDSQRTENPNIEQQETLAGLSFNNRQLFFIGFAQVWCDDVQTLFKSSVASADSHAPGMFRVIGSLSNFQEFSWVYSCRQDAPMDPEFKCTIY